MRSSFSAVRRPCTPAMQSNPLLCPIVAPGGWPGASDDDKKAARGMIKQNIAVQTGMESCIVKGAMAGVGGFAIGAFFSLMTTSMRYDNPFEASNMQGLRTSQKAAEMFKDMGRQMWRSGKGWGLLGLMFSGIECVIEGYRGRHDISNVLGGGFVTGCLISAKNGTKAGILSGLGFAAFGGAIDHFWIAKPPKEDEGFELPPGLREPRLHDVAIEY